MTDLYQVLGLPRHATTEQVRQAYRTYARHFHPDLHQNSPFFTARFREVQEAYEVLSDPAQRGRYDAGANPRPAAPFSPPPGTPDDQLRELAYLRAYVAQLEADLAYWQRLAWVDRLLTGARHLARALAARPALLWSGVAFVVWGALWQASGPARLPVPVVFKTNYQTTDGVLDGVRRKVSGGYYAEAITEADPFLRTGRARLTFTPADLATLFICRAQAKGALANDTGAVRDYVLALRFGGPDRGQYHAERAQARMRLGDVAPALADLDTAIARDAANVVAFRTRAHYHYRQGQFAAARRDYETLCRLQPGVPGYQTLAGSCAWLLGDHAAACAAWRAAAAQGQGAAADSLARYCR